MIEARIINFRKNDIKNDKTGEIKKMYRVLFELKTEDNEEIGNYGNETMTSMSSENSFETLKVNKGKWVRIEISEKPVFGKANQFQKYVSKINGVNVRDF